MTYNETALGFGGKKHLPSQNSEPTESDLGFLGLIVG